MGRFKTNSDSGISQNLLKKKTNTQDRSGYKSLSLLLSDMQKLEAFLSTVKVYDKDKIIIPTQNKASILRDALDDYYSKILKELPEEAKKLFDTMIG